MSKVYGYGRVSTEDQNLDSQEVALKAAGCEVILMEKVSGASRANRPKLALLLEVIGQGDTVIVSRLDRLSRNGVEMLQIAEEIAAKGAALKSIHEPWCDGSGPMGKFMFIVMAGVAQFFRDQSKERQREGIAQAKVRGVYRGRRPSIDAAKVHDLRTQGMGPAEIARTLKCSESSVFRIINANGHDVTV